MNEVVVGGAIVVAGANALAAALGVIGWQRQGVATRAFWPVLRCAQVTALLYAAGIGLLAATGHHSSQQLFYLYALLPLAVAFLAEQLRVASAQAVLDQRGLADARAVGELPDIDQRQLVAMIVRREIGVMTISALVVIFLALRAAGTAHGF